MLKEERQQMILEIINSEQKVIASDLSLRLAVSEDTIRRDLRELDEKSLIKRVHSGALRVGPPIIDFDKRRAVANDIKVDLAKKALPLLKENSVIMFDGGTSNLALANLIPLSFSATVITNSPPIAMALAHHENIEIIMLGGILFKESMINTGVDTADAIRNLRADLYIMGVYNIDPSLGTSVPTISEAQIKRKMVASSTEVLSLITADKLGTVSNQIVGPTNNLTYIVTDEIDSRTIAKYTEQLVTVIITD